MGYVIKDSSDGTFLTSVRFFGAGHECSFGGDRSPVIIDDYDAAQALAFVLDQVSDRSFYVDKTQVVHPVVCSTTCNLSDLYIRLRLKKEV